MYMDYLNMFDNNVAITVTRNSTNVIDMLRAGEDIGTGENLFVAVTVGTAFTAGGAATLQVALVTSAADTLGTPTTHQDQVAVVPVASLIAGFTLYMRIHPMVLPLRYMGLVYTVATGPMTAGTIYAGIVHGIQQSKAYASGFTVA